MGPRPTAGSWAVILGAEMPDTAGGLEGGRVTDFVPPQPPLLARKASMLELVQVGLRSGIGLFMTTSYQARGINRHQIPTWPAGRIRNLFTVRAPELIREVLVGRAQDFPKSRLMDGMLRALTGHSIFVSNGKEWERHRRLMDPAFGAARIRAVFPMMRDAVDACTQRIEAHLDGPQGSQPIAIDVEMTHYAADVIFRTIFSEPMDGGDARRFFRAFAVFQEIAYAHGMLKLADFPTYLLPDHWRAKWAAKVIRRILERPIQRRMAAIARGEPTPQEDIMASLLATAAEQADRFTERELLDQISMLFLAGHETSATAMAWSLYLLAQCPHLQERAHVEATKVMGAARPAFEHMKRLGFSRDVFREAMRLYPPVAFVARDSSGPETMLGREVEPGSVIFVSPWLMHRHEKFWDKPDVFDPDRFETENGQEGLRCAYLPFSMGPRVCAGASFALQEATLLLAELVRRFRFLPVDGHTPEPVARLTLRSANGVPLIVERR